MRPLALPSVPVKDGQDVTQLNDEQLVTVVQESGCRPAQDELIKRCLDHAHKFICYQVYHHGLQEADLQDAQQEAVLWILEAIRRYRKDEASKPGGCHFQSFAHQVLAARLVDFFRHLRVRKVFSLAAGMGVRSQRDGHKLRTDDEAALTVPAKDPPTSVEAAEEYAHLQQELERLGEYEKGLWRLLAAGTSLQHVAAILGISYDAAKRRRRSLLAQLRSSLSNHPLRGATSRPSS